MPEQRQFLIENECRTSYECLTFIFIKNRRRSAVSIAIVKHISHIFHNFEHVIASWDRRMHFRLSQTFVTELFTIIANC